MEAAATLAEGAFGSGYSLNVRQAHLKRTINGSKGDWKEAFLQLKSMREESLTAGQGPAISFDMYKAVILQAIGE